MYCSSHFELNRYSKLNDFLSAAICQRPRNYLSCCCSCCSCSPFPLQKKFKWKKNLPDWESTQVLLIHSQALIYRAIGINDDKINFYISPQTLYQYWLTLVSLVLYPAYLFTTCLFLSLWLWLWLLFFSLPSFYLLRLFLFHLLSLTWFAFSLTPFLLIQFNFEDIEWKYSQCSGFT